MFIFEVGGGVLFWMDICILTSLGSFMNRIPFMTETLQGNNYKNTAYT